VGEASVQFAIAGPLLVIVTPAWKPPAQLLPML